MLRKLLTIGGLALSVISAPTVAGDVADAINAVANGDHRSDDYKARNESRHPGETLEFFGIRDDMTVVEISPGGGGWYTEILAPYLKEKGAYYAGSYDPDSKSDYSQRNSKKYSEKLASKPDLYSDIKVTVFSVPNKMEAAPEASADMVLTFRNMHNWIRGGNGEATMNAMFSYLKSGGVLGLVQHRSDPNPTNAKHGYVSESDIIKLAEAAGFTFEAKSEINANPKDKKDHPNGVWNLPPSYDAGDTDRAKYQAIGESDRMTMRFRKP